MDISKLSVTELKALAYDESVKLQAAQYNIQLLNQELAKREKAEPEKPAEPVESPEPKTEE